MDLVKNLNKKRDHNLNYLNKNLNQKKERYLYKKKVFKNHKLDHIKKF